MVERAYLSIGEVLALLKDEFPEITISKIRFLESQGLLNPERTPSGYRKFYEPDVERLRWILQQQRENFLPLKVIKGRLGMEPGNGDDSPEGPSPAPAASAPASPPPDQRPQPRPEARPESRPAPRPAQPPPGRRPIPPPPPRPAERRPEPTPPPVQHQRHQQPAPPAQPAADRPSGPSTVPQAPERAPRPEPRPAPAPMPESVATAPAPPPDAPVNLTRDELLSAAGITLDQLAELEKFGLLTPRQAGGAPYYDGDSLIVARVAASFMQFGVEARHLRMYKNAADREAGVFEQIVMPLMKQRNPDARRQAVDTLGQLASLGEQLRAALLHDALREHTTD